MRVSATLFNSLVSLGLLDQSVAINAVSRHGDIVCEKALLIKEFVHIRQQPRESSHDNAARFIALSAAQTEPAGVSRLFIHIATLTAVHAKVAVVLVQRVERRDVWHILDHFIDPLDALDHLVAAPKIEIKIYYSIDEEIDASHPKHSLSNSLIVTRALSQRRTRELES